MNTRDVKLDTRFFCLFKGDPGSGKSIAAGSYPNPFFFDIDRRMKSVINFWRPRGREFDYDQPNSFFDVNRRLEQFVDECPYQTIVYDGVTTGSLQILNDMISSRPTGSKKVERAGIEMYQIEDYGGESRGLNVIINNLKVISLRWHVNVIVTAHVLTTETTDIVKKVTTVSRALMTAGKKVAAAFPVHFDEGYHFDVQPSMQIDQPPHYTVVTRNTGFDWAKTALNLPMRIDFTDQSLYDIIMGYLRGAEAQNQPVDDLAL